MRRATSGDTQEAKMTTRKQLKMTNGRHRAAVIRAAIQQAQQLAERDFEAGVRWEQFNEDLASHDRMAEQACELAERYVESVPFEDGAAARNVFVSAYTIGYCGRLYAISPVTRQRERTFADYVRARVVAKAAGSPAE